MRAGKRSLTTAARTVLLLLLLAGMAAASSAAPVTVSGWKMQDAARVDASPERISSGAFVPQGWYDAVVPGTVLTTLVQNGVYSEPLYGEEMRVIPESLNKTSYWYRAAFAAPRQAGNRRTWLHFAGINYSAEVWVNGSFVGSIRGAFLRGDFDVSGQVSPGTEAVVAVLVHPQPHAGTPHEHTVAGGMGPNGGDTAADGPTFLATIGWDWLPAVRDRNTGIWLPVTVDDTGPVVLKDTFVTSRLDDSLKQADLVLQTTLVNTGPAVRALLTGSFDSGDGVVHRFQQQVDVAADGPTEVRLDGTTLPGLHVSRPRLWWPNGYGKHNLYRMHLRLSTAQGTSDEQTVQFGIRRITYSLPAVDFLTISVNNVPIMVRGGNWGMDEGLKRNTRDRLETQFRMHAIANMNMIRNWVGQSTAPDFYDIADKYGMLLWDEFFQPNPGDGPEVEDIGTYLANVRDKVIRYRNHPSIAVWCARNEGYPPPALDDMLRTMMEQLDPSRLYQSNSADGRGVSSHGPYHWREPKEFYKVTEAFKTETGAMSVPTIESVQGMMPPKDWESVNDDWAQHDFARGAVHGDEYPRTIATRYGPVRNLADFVRKSQMANYEDARAMYEGRNAQMFQKTSGVLMWMSNPAQPSFVWQIYHHDLEPNSTLYAVKSAAEPVHVQWNEATDAVQIVNNRPEALRGLRLRVQVFDASGSQVRDTLSPVPSVAPSSVLTLQRDSMLEAGPLRVVRLTLLDRAGHTLSRNTYWRAESASGLSALNQLPVVPLDFTTTRTAGGDLRVTVTNLTGYVALLAHLQLHRREGGRVLPTFLSDNYLNLVPGESRGVELSAGLQHDLRAGDYLTLDGFNVSVGQTSGPIPVRINLNALPENWPASAWWAALGADRPNPNAANAAN